ncbi:SRPBCC family protein [Marisediminicola antarctica]|uniref:Polyketide cyclase n=1 Tax=Marisediminicola antarctica TaxID=674079 RepID=A0A7L5AI74_9MICO|nr:SRPBCC domain-containing protein [Marisediminicola antarctica]QHO70263.1 polyketide cyclase [Marisediminicola antarctica]
MTVVSIEKDAEALTMKFVAEFDASVDRVWQLWKDPRQLERWWGQPTYPATFDKHDFRVGGRSAYHMTGPEGEKPRGWWQITAIEEPTRFEFDDGFADDDGTPVEALGIVHGVVTLEAAGGKTRMTSLSRFESAEQLEQMMEMGMAEGMREAIGQIDAILAELRV